MTDKQETRLMWKMLQASINIHRLSRTRGNSRRTKYWKNILVKHAKKFPYVPKEFGRIEEMPLVC